MKRYNLISVSVFFLLSLNTKVFSQDLPPTDVHLKDPSGLNVIKLQPQLVPCKDWECKDSDDRILSYNFLRQHNIDIAYFVDLDFLADNRKLMSFWSTDEDMRDFMLKWSDNKLDQGYKVTPDDEIRFILGKTNYAFWGSPKLHDYDREIDKGGLYLWFQENKYFDKKFQKVEEFYSNGFLIYPDLKVPVNLGKKSETAQYGSNTHIWYRRYIDYKFPYIGFNNKEAELVYNPSYEKRKAYLVVGDILKYYRDNINGYEELGPPLGDMQCISYTGECRQEFEKGSLVWNGADEYTDSYLKITHYKKDGGSISSCTDDNTCRGKRGGGPGTSTPPADAPAPGRLPDFITSKVTMGNKDGNHEKYTWKINETAYVHDYIDNIGDADWEGSAREIKIPFYLSKGSKKDSSSEWVRIGDRQEIKREHLKVNQPPKHESITFKLQDWANDGTIMPGRTYNFVVCADRPKDEDNGDGDVKEKHKSNNCSTEAVFYVDYGPPRNVDLLARNLALTGGRSSLQAGEKYGLQVEVSNIGTEQPWNGFLTNYEIKGPSTGGAWQKIGEDTSKASSLYPGAIHFEAMDGDDEVAAPMVGGDYVFRACADYTQAVPETDESNNCTDELPVYVVPPPMPDIITEGLQLTHGRTSLIAGELYGLTVNVRNIGEVGPSSYSYTKYEIKGPGTGDAWQQVAEDGTKAEHLEPGMAHWEEISDEEGLHIPAVPGTYIARACADYKGNIPESDEGNNCSEMTFEVQSVPAGSPSIVITNPNSDDDWRSDETDHDFRWDYFDFPERGHVRIEYSLDGGATWLLVTDSTDNDGRKYWEDMCDYHTVDTHHAFVRITSVEYPYVYDVSDEFSIDHAAECK